MADQPIRVVVEKKPSGCWGVFGVMLLIGFAVEYWYISLGVLVLFVVAGVISRSQQSKQRALEQQKARCKPGPRDPWLNEVAVALADLGFVEVARNTGAQIGGAPFEGDIGLEADRLAVWVHLFTTPRLAREADVGLRAQRHIRDAIASGRTVIRGSGRVLVVAHGRQGIVDEFQLDEVLLTVAKLTLPPPLAAADERSPSAAGSAQHRPAEGTDTLAQLKQLAELRNSGVISDAEFEAKKTELLARI